MRLSEHIESEYASPEEWPDTPDRETIQKITSLYEAACHVNEKDPSTTRRTFNITLFLMRQNILGDKLLTYEKLMKEEVRARNGGHQLEMTLG